jgi:hypothetical protein
MTSKAIRALFGTLLVAAVLGVVPAVASATTTYATFGNLCRLREYPPDSCANGFHEFTVGYGNGGEAVSIIEASWSIPPGNEVCEATLRVTNDDAMTGTVEVGEPNSNFDVGDTWYTWDVWNEINTLASYSPGAVGEDEIDFTDALASWSGGYLTFFGPNSSGGYLSDPELEIEYATSC